MYFFRVNNLNKYEETVNLKKEQSIIQENDYTITSNEKNTNDNECKWRIEIPVINLVAEIAEGTNDEILNKYVGHFEETSCEEGNIALAAHNRGYENNYFQDLKLLHSGDMIKYEHYNFNNVYVVTKNKIIKDTDLTCLENTEDKNEITLITCIENEPEYRRCVKAIEKEEEIIE